MKVKRWIGRATRPGRSAIQGGALAVSALLLFSACAGGAAPAAAGATQAPVPNAVKIGRVRTLSYMPAYLAESLGYLDAAAKQLNTKIEVVPFDSSSQSLPALVAGQTDFDVQLAQNAASAQVQGQNLMVVNTFDSSGTGGLVVDPQITSAKDLVGKEVGITGLATIAYPELLASLKKDGVSGQQIKFVTIASQASLASAFTSHRLAGVVVGEPVISELVGQHGGTLLYNWYDRSYIESVMGGPIESITLMTTKVFSQKYPQVTQAVVTAMLKALKWMEDNKGDPDLVLSKLPSEYANLKPIFPTILSHIESAASTDGVVDPKALETVVAISKSLGAIPLGKSVDVNALFDNRYAKNAGVFGKK